ncbi:MAG: hypothetical protein HY235_13440 [Acidobacteria bacterium]|nr:hypothetical protein [Acidobacteriota bacterium]
MRLRPLITVLAVLTALPVCCADWNARLAADYLDGRQKEWFAWKQAAASGGPCVSCHTGMTYLLARPALRRVLGENQPTRYETGLLRGLRARVSNKEPVASPALGVEAVLSALFLSREDAAIPAFERMWSLQIRDGNAKGAWAWFQLDLDPWETPDSRFFGASLAALAAGAAPAAYRDRPEIRERVAQLASYLGRERQGQPLHNRLTGLWAATTLPEALPESMRQPLIDEVWRKQEADGGWTLEALGPWKEHSAAPRWTASNAYSTGFVAFVLQKAGVARSHPKLSQALDWLRSHQDRQSGHWSADSMNKRYEPGSMPARFMRDAATGFAALALLEAEP